MQRDGPRDFDPRGNRQMDAQACPFDSLHTGIRFAALTRPEDIAAVNEYRPDYIGFVFAPSKRNVSEMRAAGLKKLLSPDITAVGSICQQSHRRHRTAREPGIIGAVQLHGDMEGFETVQYAEDLKEGAGRGKAGRFRSPYPRCACKGWGRYPQGRELSGRIPAF